MTTATYTPIRQFKKRRRNRNMHQRMVRKKWYQRNKSKLRTKRQQRYKQLRKNPTWKKWQTKLRKEKNKRHMIGSCEPAPIFGIEVGGGVWLGVLQSLDVGEDVIRALSMKSGRAVVIPLQLFLENAAFADPELEQSFWDVLETVYGQDELVTS